jgi:hypothetical protein
MWLRMNPNATYELKILDSRPESRKTHWVDGKSVMCTGDNCVYCRQGKRVKITYIYNVEDKMGNTWKWEFGNQVLKQLIAHEPNPVARQGAWITVKRIGEGLKTSYMVLNYLKPNSDAKAEEGTKVAIEDITELKKSLDLAYGLLCDVAQFANRAIAAIRIVYGIMGYEIPEYDEEEG